MFYFFIRIKFNSVTSILPKFLTFIKILLNNWSCFKCKFIVQTVCIDHFNCVYLIHLHHLFIWLAIVLSCLRLVDKNSVAIKSNAAKKNCSSNFYGYRIVWMYYCCWWCRFIQNTPQLLLVSFHKPNFWDPHKWWINTCWNYGITWKIGVFHFHHHFHYSLHHQ